MHIAVQQVQHGVPFGSENAAGVGRGDINPQTPVFLQHLGADTIDVPKVEFGGLRHDDGGQQEQEAKKA